jgi:formiminoglutamase
MARLPFLLSIPHGGRKIPQEVKDRVSLSPVDLFDDGDAYTREIYDLGDRVAEVISTNIARAFVDLNRAPDDLPPGNTDGAVKSHTCYGKVIYKAGLEPDQTLIKTLLEKYYHPYHQRIQKTLDEESPEIKLALDCHSMAAVGPEIAPDPGQRRPMICLGNRHGQTCPAEMVEELARCFREVFNLEAPEVTINQPFAGGYITRTYDGNPIPWIQVEMSRALYLTPPYFDRQTLQMDQAHLRELKRKFERVLRLFAGAL